MMISQSTATDGTRDQSIMTEQTLITLIPTVVFQVMMINQSAVVTRDQPITMEQTLIAFIPVKKRELSSVLKGGQTENKFIQ
jgi:hypothetical protein